MGDALDIIFNLEDKVSDLTEQNRVLKLSLDQWINENNEMIILSAEKDRRIAELEERLENMSIDLCLERGRDNLGD